MSDFVREKQYIMLEDKRRAHRAMPFLVVLSLAVAGFGGWYARDNSVDSYSVDVPTLASPVLAPTEDITDEVVAAVLTARTVPTNTATPSPVPTAEATRTLTAEEWKFQFLPECKLVTPSTVYQECVHLDTPIATTATPIPTPTMVPTCEPPTARKVYTGAICSVLIQPFEAEVEVPW